MLNNILLESRRNEENQTQRNSESSVPDNSTMQTNNLQQSSNLNLTTQEAGSRNTFTQLDQIYQPLLQPNQQLSGLNDQQKQRFLIQITGIWVFQEAIQIIMSVITILDFNYDNLFYNFDKEKYRASLYLFFFIFAIQLLLIRFYKPFRCVHIQNYYQETQCIFHILDFHYLLCLMDQRSHHCRTFRYMEYRKLCPDRLCYFHRYYMQFSYLDHYSISLLSDQIIDIIFQQNTLIFIGTIKYVFIPPFIYAFIFQIFNPFDYTAVLIFWMATELWAFTFGGLYLYSVLQIINGKFNLNQDQTISAALLAFINMFFPFGHI
ncbi:unnamed protein product (macronuclear) [Paramecium tetraurelia]|uniref:Transmembrane protein n=1 Tax=Paramecium tetraurelia TaxID=5888 RepID=A0D9V3_PARTE|nr:uncharacterized protein GSPATT00014751001 [Paramecium tetraurelia]CAK79820.1 unnamed protein product [Paramecium tetraurelia]|eukprot:XP_001447217.1 hypothetical protein (macronuclear) [Paramecium tetraurelia strain d4-2]